MAEEQRRIAELEDIIKLCYMVQVDTIKESIRILGTLKKQEGIMDLEDVKPLVSRLSNIVNNSYSFVSKMNKSSIKIPQVIKNEYENLKQSFNSEYKKLDNYLSKQGVLF